MEEQTVRRRAPGERPGKEAALGRPAASKRAAWRLRVEWELLLWMIGSFAVLYFTNFASHLLFNPVVKRWWLAGSVLAFSTCVGCLVYSMRKHTTLDSTNWQEKAPVLIPIATLSALTGVVSLWVSVWPVWKFFTLLIIPLLAMGFVSTVSLFNL